MITILLLTAASLVCSFCCSLAEGCVYSVSRSRIESLRRQGRKSGERLARLRANIDEAIAAILILNTVASSAGGSLIGAMVVRRFPETMWLGHVSAVMLFTIIFTGGILFFSEIIPKTIGVKFANSVAPALALPLRWTILALYPLVRLCVAATRLFGPASHLHTATEEDIVSLVALGQRAGSILPEEERWITNALRLNDETAYDLMTPNSVVARVPETMPLSMTTIDAQHWRFSRVPVCRDDNPDEIVGVVYRAKVFDALAKDQFHLTMGELMIPPDFVEATTPAHELLDLFLRKRRHLFCVRNEAGAFIGVVSLEDVIECLLGAEIVEEKDLHDDMQELARQRMRRLLAQSREMIEKKSKL